MVGMGCVSMTEITVVSDLAKRILQHIRGPSIVGSCIIIRTSHRPQVRDATGSNGLGESLLVVPTTYLNAANFAKLGVVG